ncbi:MAG: DUF2344 domain-containing protein [Clostridia bacterium]|nr:DUF2344 domain-containing protein [Clostridia bacterium]
MNSLRIWFKKVGRAKYISHLDLMRSMTKAIKRSGLKVWYTEGFNPHAYITFPLPLSLGIESESECVDIRVEDGVTPWEVKEKLFDQMPEGLDLVSVEEPFLNAKEIRYGRYVVTLDFENENQAESFASLLQKLVDEKSLVCEKKGKKGHKKIMKEVPLGEHIFNFKTEVKDNVLVINVDLSAGNPVNIAPNLFIGAIEKKSPILPLYKKFEKKCLLTESFEIFR